MSATSSKFHQYLCHRHVFVLYQPWRKIINHLSVPPTPLPSLSNLGNSVAWSQCGMEEGRRGGKERWREVATWGGVGPMGGAGRFTTVQSGIGSASPSSPTHPPTLETHYQGSELWSQGGSAQCNLSKISCVTGVHIRWRCRYCEAVTDVCVLYYRCTSYWSNKDLKRSFDSPRCSSTFCMFAGFELFFVPKSSIKILF